MTDIVTELRQRHRNTTGLDPRITNPIVGPTIFLEAAAYIERLRKERDEARREVCRLSHEAHNLACEVAHYPKNAPSQQEYAKSLGWDCFKENTNG